MARIFNAVRAENTPSRRARGDVKQALRAGAKKRAVPYGTALISCLAEDQSANLIQLQGHGALLVSGIVLVQNALGGSLIDSLHGNLVSALGLGAIAISGSSLKLLDGGLHRGSLSLVAGIAGLSHQHALLSGLDIRQTKHLLQWGLWGSKHLPHAE